MSISAIKLHDVSSRNIVNLVLVFANAAGALLYLRLASGGWRIESEYGVVPVAGEPLVWAFALPVLGIFFIVDVVWAVILLRQHQRWRSTLVAYQRSPLVLRPSRRFCPSLRNTNP